MNLDANRSYSRQELLAGIQIIDWALTRMYLYGPSNQGKTKRRPKSVDLESYQAMELARLVHKWGHQDFRDQIANLVPAHAEGARLGQEAAGITDYRRSHDLVWTECFMGLCCDLSGERLSLKPDWQKTAIVVWMNIGDEIRAGIAPDFESFEETAKRLDTPPED